MMNTELLKVIEEAKASNATELDLSKRGLTSLPPELFQLTNLTGLYLQENQLTSLPQEIAQLRNLQRLILWSNKLTALPSEIGQLTSLAVLSIGGNQLTSLPPELFQLTSLTALYLRSNQLTALPPEIGQLTNLTALNLHSNQLASLPPEICQLTKLKELDLYGIPLIPLPPEIAKKGIDAILRYFSGLDKGRRPLNEVKILLVGEGAAGKTSLVKQLLGEEFDQHEDTTHGISIRGWEQEVGGRKIRINIWDFGGQEIQHATHQFFLSKRSLYVLVLDGRKDERTEYWLRHIEAFGGDSPVLIILNKMDSNPSFDINRHFIQKKYPGIQGFFCISCKTGKGIAEFKEKLLAELTTVKMLETVWPASWFTIKRKLEEIDRPYISAAEYRTFCQEVQIVDEQSRETLVDFLHDLGVAVHFKDFILEAMHVLDPVWVTESVYKIITAEEIADSKGVLRLKHLGKILPHGNGEKVFCLPEIHPFIIGLMEKFELCYPVGKEAVLIPQLLPVNEPPFSFNENDSLRFALHYPDFLPPSVFPRFMVKVYKDIEDNLRWRTGVVLKDKRSKAQALVKADVEARRINICVQGDQRREYLHYLRYLLTDINSGFEKLKIMEQVPLSDVQDITADYATLLEYVKNSIDKYIPTGSTQVYSVHQLLGLVQPKDKAELERVAEKIGLDDDEKISFWEIFTSPVEIKVMPPFFDFNLTDMLKKFIAWKKQKQQQSRK